MFFKHTRDGKIVVLIIYIDDIIVTSNNVDEIKRLKEVLAKAFEIKDLGILRYFLGIEVVRSSKGVFLSQRKYVLDLLKETRILDTPIDSNHNLGVVLESDVVNKVRY